MAECQIENVTQQGPHKGNWRQTTNLVAEGGGCCSGGGR